MRRGIITRAQYERAQARPSALPPQVSCELLDVGEHASPAEERMFEAAQIYLQTSNGTYRTSFARRFRDLDAAVLRLLQRQHAASARLQVQDRAVSHALTSCEWAGELFRAFPQAELEASDVLLHVLRARLANGAAYIAEPGGKPIQYIRAPFVVSLCGREPRRYVVNRVVASRAWRRFAQAWGAARAAGGGVSVISCLHPQARRLRARDPRFRVVLRSVFEPTPPVDVVRTMNIFNLDYFPEARLAAGVGAVWASLKPGALWIVGSTLESDHSNHATLFERAAAGWTVLERLGRGVEAEALMLSVGAGGHGRA